MDISELEKILSEELRLDKRKIFWLSKLIQSFYFAKTTNLSKVARTIKHESKIQSRYRRIQRFFESFEFSQSACAKIIMNLFDWEGKKPYLLMDRTEWQYGNTWINILVVAVAYKRVAIPIAWVVLPKRGNSSIQARAELLESIFAEIEITKFGGLLADREFIGHEWFAYLKKLKLPFYIRVKAGADTQNARGQSVEVGWLFHHLKPGEQMALPGKRKIYGHDLKIWGARSPANGDLMVVVSNDESENNIEVYLQRWDIETLFGSLKSHGFNFEETHMVAHPKIRRLLFVLTLAYAWALKVGIFINQRVKIIPLKKHRRRLYSFFRAGLDFLCEAFFTRSAKAIKIAVKVLTHKHIPPLRPKQIEFLRSFVVY